MNKKKEHELDAKDIQRFWSKVAKSGESDCWNWTAGKLKAISTADNRGYRRSGGYGRFSACGRYVRRPHHHYMAHRVAYALTFGAIPDEMTVDHKCFNPSCCNPSHLRLLTVSENSQRKNPNRPWLLKNRNHQEVA